MQVESGWFSLVEENTYALVSDRKACEVEVSEAVALAEEESAFSLVEEGANEVFLVNGQVICDELR
jgi:hypothetical protein